MMDDGNVSLVYHKILAEVKGEIYQPQPIKKPKLEENTPGFIFLRKLI